MADKIKRNSTVCLCVCARECVRERACVRACAHQNVFLTCINAREAACSRAFSCRLVLVVLSISSSIWRDIRSQACRGNSACGIEANVADVDAIDDVRVMPRITLWQTLLESQTVESGYIIIISSSSSSSSNSSIKMFQSIIGLRDLIPKKQPRNFFL